MIPAKSESTAEMFAPRDLVLLVVLLLMALTPVGYDIARVSTPGPFARVAVNRELVNRRAGADGTLPLWNPYEFGGRPHLADPEMLSLYPPHLLLRFVPLPLFFPISFALHTWLAGAGTYCAARKVGVSRRASVLAGGVAVGGRLFIPLEDRAYSIDVYGLAWLPLVAACSLRSAEASRWLPRPALVVVATLGLLASALNPTYVLATVAGCYLFSGIWLQPGVDRRSHLVAQPLILAALAAGIASVQIVPSVRFWTTTRGDRDLAADVLSLPAVPTATTAPRVALDGALRSLPRGGRVLSTCSRATGGSDFVRLGIPGVGGSGGVFSADYARFSHLVRGAIEKMRPVFEGIPEAASGPARMDLLKMLGVEYLVACDPPNAQHWSTIGTYDGAGIYRIVAPAPRAFWTCAPHEAGRDELEYRLRHASYDTNLVLQPHAIIYVRWPPGIADTDRARAESELRLAPHRDIADRTWEYNVLDRSPDNVVAIQLHPLVEDTQRIERGTGRLSVSPATPRTFDEPKSERLLGAESCRSPVPAVVQEQDRFDGRMVVDVTAPHDGMVFFSETYYQDRRAWVDGLRIARLKVNYAFTGVAVRSGRHRIELKFDTRSLWLGAALSVVTLLIWLVAERRSRLEYA